MKNETSRSFSSQLILGAVVIVLGLAVLYRFGPSREHAQWRWLTVGAVVAMVLWIAGSALFSWYLSNFADFNATYGSLGAGIGLMMWLWLTSIAVLIGAELNAEMGEDGFFTTDRNGVVASVSLHARILLGETEQELIGRPLTLVVGGDPL